MRKAPWCLAARSSARGRSWPRRRHSTAFRSMVLPATYPPPVRLARGGAGRAFASSLPRSAAVQLGRRTKPPTAEAARLSEAQHCRRLAVAAICALRACELRGGLAPTVARVLISARSHSALPRKPLRHSPCGAIRPPRAAERSAREENGCPPISLGDFSQEGSSRADFQPFSPGVLGRV